MNVSEQLRKAIEDYGIYAVSRDSKTPYPILYRFVNYSQGLAMSTMDKLCTFMGMGLTGPTRERPEPRPPGRPRKVKAPETPAKGKAPVKGAKAKPAGSLAKAKAPTKPLKRGKARRGR